MMDQDKLDDYLKNIEELVIDEGKIVTYKCLSRTLGLNVNTAKQLLYTFASTHGKSYGENIMCTYQISGVKSDGSYKLSLVNENDLPEIRLSLVDILSEHVYSVQRTKELTDFQILYVVDPFDTSAFNESPISCSECIPIANKSLAKMVTVTQPNIKPPVIAKKTEENTSKKVQSISGDSTKEDVKKNLKSEEAVKEVTEKITKVKVDSPKEKPSQKKGNSISSMFSAQSLKANSTAKKVEKPKEAPKIKESEMEITEVVEKVVSKKVDKSKVKRKTKPKQDDLKDKKRKRIRVFSDSEDSDQDSAKERSPSPEPEAEPEPEPINIESDQENDLKSIEDSSGVSPATHKRKKRKVVDKLVMTKEGYMETTKEVVFETDSEPEPETSKPIEVKKTSPVKRSEVKKTSPVASTKKPVSPKKGKAKAANDGRKQASLLSFFKKN